jgi:phosphatidylglycerophosphate synthase
MPTDKFHKLSNEDEGVLDVLLRPSATATADWANSKGLIPNQITIFRTILGGISLYFLWKGDLGLWITFYLVNYFLDCADGIQARKYNKVTKLGDVLDHVSDVMIAVGAVMILISKYDALKRTDLVIASVVLGLLFAIQTARQQEECKEEGDKGGMLDLLCGFAKIPLPNCVVKNFSAAFVALWIAGLPVMLRYT